MPTSRPPSGVSKDLHFNPGGKAVTQTSNDNEWQNLDWVEKLQICQQGIAHEDSLLHTYVTIFIAIEALFFVLVFSLDLPSWLLLVISLFAIIVSILFIYYFRVV